MAGDTLRGIGKKQLAEALENAGAPDHTTEPNGTAGAASAASTTTASIDAQASPERSLDDLPSERTGHANNHHSGAHAAMPISTATTIVQDAPAPAEIAPVVDDAVPLPATPSTPRSGPNRVSFGTMIGHEMHSVQARVASAVADADAGSRGTAHGRDVHFPAHPGMAVEPETVAVVAPPIAAPEPAAPVLDDVAPARDSLNEFSGGDHGFFDTAPVNDEYEPENPRGRLYTRLAVSGAVIAVVSVVVVAWVNSHSNEEPPPVEVKSQPAVVTPTATAAVAPAHTLAPPARSKEAPPTSTIPSSSALPDRPVAAIAPAPAAPARIVKTPAVAPAAPAREAKPTAIASAAPVKTAPIALPPKPAPIAASPPPRVAPVAAAAVRELRTPPPPQKKPPAVAAAPRAPPSPPPAARPTPAPMAKTPRQESATSRPVAKSNGAARGSKGAAAHGKQKYDPDGTLPLSFE